MKLDDVKNALIISPHPDDETFGCGGLIRSLLLSNKRVSLIILSRGEAVADTAHTAHHIISEREKLVRQTCQNIGLEYHDVYWLNFPDGNFKKTCKTEIYNLDKLIHDISPDTIFYPHPWECSPDHEKTTELIESILNETKIKRYYYCVWLWYHMMIYKIPFLKFNSSFQLKIDKSLKTKNVLVYSEATDSNGFYYSGKLPEMFLKAVTWNKELFFKV